MKSKLKISFIINIIIVVLTIMGTITVFFGIRFMEGKEPELQTTKIGMFKFFTVDSNIFMGIIAGIFACYQFKLLKGTIKEIPTKLYIWKLMSTTSVGLTFWVVVLYLSRIYEGGLYPFMINSGLFFHLLVPVISMLSFIFLDKTDKIKLKYSFLGAVPMLLYGLFYMGNSVIHSENGVVSPKYDWYYFVQGGIWQMVIVIPVMFVITYIISICLWKLNKSFIKNS